MQTVLQVEHLKKCYGDKCAVDDVSFSVQKGTVFGLLGANGAGKSTTIECVLGTQKKDGGTVQLLGLNPLTHRKTIFQRVGVQFQDSAYQSQISVGELCEITQCVYKKPTPYKELLTAFGLAEKAKAKVATLSGGERQRLFIVLALIPNPEFVFLDELTTGLDAVARKEVWAYLLKLKESGLSIFLTSHFMDEVERLCDSIVILKQGKAVFSGTTQQAVQQSGKQNLEDAYVWFIQEQELGGGS